MSDENVPNHISWLVDTGQKLVCGDGKEVAVWEVKHTEDGAVLSSWAKHFRTQYCSDDEIDTLRKGGGYTRKAYLEAIKLPDTSSLGSSIRSGDFGEILVSDYLQYIFDYWVPRTRYSNKTIRNESSKGSDVLGFKFIEEGKESPGDTLATFETKSQLTSKPKKPRLQDAIDDSHKDQIRKAESLNAINQRLRQIGHSQEAEKIERFQDKSGRPYNEVSGAVALFSNNTFDSALESTASSMNHWNKNSLTLLVIKGENMMQLVHELYRRAADEA